MKYQFDLFCESKDTILNNFDQKFHVLCEHIDADHFDEFWKDAFVPAFFDHAEEGIDGVMDALLNEVGERSYGKGWKDWGKKLLGPLGPKQQLAQPSGEEQAATMRGADYRNQPSAGGDTAAERGTTDWYSNFAQSKVPQTQNLFMQYLDGFGDYAEKYAQRLSSSATKGDDTWWTAKAIHELAPRFTKAAKQASGNLSVGNLSASKVKSAGFDTTHKGERGYEAGVADRLKGLGTPAEKATAGAPPVEKPVLRVNPPRGKRGPKPPEDIMPPEDVGMGDISFKQGPAPVATERPTGMTQRGGSETAQKRRREKIAQRKRDAGFEQAETEEAGTKRGQEREMRNERGVLGRGQRKDRERRLGKPKRKLRGGGAGGGGGLNIPTMQNAHHNPKGWVFQEWTSF